MEGLRQEYAATEQVKAAWLLESNRLGGELQRIMPVTVQLLAQPLNGSTDIAAQQHATQVLVQVQDGVQRARQQVANAEAHKHEVMGRAHASAERFHAAKRSETNLHAQVQQQQDKEARRRERTTPQHHDDAGLNSAALEAHRRELQQQCDEKQQFTLTKTLLHGEGPKADYARGGHRSHSVCVVPCPAFFEIRRAAIHQYSQKYWWYCAESNENHMQGCPGNTVTLTTPLLRELLVPILAEIDRTSKPALVMENFQGRYPTYASTVTKKMIARALHRDQEELREEKELLNRKYFTYLRELVGTKNMEGTCAVLATTSADNKPIVRLFKGTLVGVWTGNESCERMEGMPPGFVPHTGLGSETFNHVAVVAGPALDVWEHCAYRTIFTDMSHFKEAKVAKFNSAQLCVFVMKSGLYSTRLSHGKPLVSLCVF